MVDFLHLIIKCNKVKRRFIQDVHTPLLAVLLRYQVTNSHVLAKQQLYISCLAIELSYLVWFRCSSFSVYVSSIRCAFCFFYSFILPPIILIFVNVTNHHIGTGTVIKKADIIKETIITMIINFTSSLSLNFAVSTNSPIKIMLRKAITVQNIIVFCISLPLSWNLVFDIPYDYQVLQFPKTQN